MFPPFVSTRPFQWRPTREPCLFSVWFLFFGLQVEREYISYIHDGSETQKDSFTIVANQTEIRKHSLPCVVHVNITPVNDETPVVTANEGLKVRR